jgi:DNA-binding IclR family transcriptional regulator
MAKIEEAQVTPERLLQFGFAYAPPLIIGAAVANRVFDTLANGAESVEEISRETGASVRGLRAIMNALVGLELLKKSGGKYALTPESRRLSDQQQTRHPRRLFQHEPGAIDAALDETR